MTTETSNARGEVVAERHALYGIRWVKQLRDMRPGTQWFIEGREWPIATVTSSAGVLWHMAESEIPHGTKYYTAPPPAAARVDVRGLVDYDAGLLNDFGGGDVNWWQDYLRAEIERANEFWREQTEQALAAEGVQAGEVEQRARELLAAEYQKRGHGRESAEALASYIERHECAAFDAIASALSQQPEARGGVEMPGMVRELERIGRLGEGEPVWLEPSEAISILAALTGERNG